MLELGLVLTTALAFAAARTEVVPGWETLPLPDEETPIPMED